MDYCNTSILPDYKKNDEEHEFVIRVFNERYNVDRSYYEGSSDIKFAVRASDPIELLKLWMSLSPFYVGETYSVWKDGKVVTGGAWDEDDWMIIARDQDISIDDIKSRDFYSDYIIVQEELKPIAFIRDLKNNLNETLRSIMPIKKEV